MYCSRCEDLEVNLRSSTLGWTPLYHAIFAGHTNVVKYLVAQRADINAKAGTSCLRTFRMLFYPLTLVSVVKLSYICRGDNCP